MFRHIAASITALALMGCLAVAEPSVSALSVKYSDLDLSTPSGAKVMLERIKRAAGEACKYPPGTIVQRRCIAETVAKAVTELKAPEVTRLASRR